MTKHLLQQWSNRQRANPADKANATMRSKWAQLRFLILVALILTASAGVFGATTTKARAATTITGLHVSGNQLLNGTNNVFRPLGVDRAGAEYMCDAAGDTTVFDGPTDAASVNAMASWYINIVRLPLNEDCWLGINGYPAAQYTAAQYQQAIINYVNLLNSYNIAVILDLHWSAPGTTQANKQVAMPDLDHTPAFWSSVATTFKNNSSVIFDLFNEPFTTSWSCWLNGSIAPAASPCTDLNFAVAGMQTLVNTVRSTGATNPIMLGGLSYANDLSQWLQYKPTDPNNSLIASFHLYNFNSCTSVSCWNSQIAPVAAQVPLVAGELGENDCAHSFIDTAMSWFDQENIGYLGWAWDTYGCSSFPALISSYDGTPTAFGVGLKNHLAALAGVPPTGGTTCQVTYSSSSWGTGFTTALSIINRGNNTINGWTLTFTFPGNQQIIAGWNGRYYQQKEQVTIQNVSYNASIPAGYQANLSFYGSYSGTNANPTAFSLNGQQCSVG